MLPDAIIALITETLRLINNIIEGTPIEQRKANSIIAYNMVWPIYKGLLPSETVTQIEEIMKGVK